MHVLESTCPNQAASLLLPGRLPGYTVVSFSEKMADHDLLSDFDTPTRFPFNDTELCFAGLSTEVEKVSKA